MPERAVPVLPGRDLGETLAFYETLGFENRGAPPDEWDYLIIGRGELEIHFYAAPEPGPTGRRCYAFVADAQALHDEWTAVVAPGPTTGSHLGTPMDTEYGMREFDVVDPTGNIVRVGSPTA
jgi:hypothetical protein